MISSRSKKRSKQLARRQNQLASSDGSEQNGTSNTTLGSGLVEEQDDRDRMESSREHPLLYSAPTVDSLGDESLLIRPYYASSSGRAMPSSPARPQTPTRRYYTQQQQYHQAGSRSPIPSSRKDVASTPPPPTPPTQFPSPGQGFQQFKQQFSSSATPIKSNHASKLSQQSPARTPSTSSNSSKVMRTPGKDGLLTVGSRHNKTTISKGTIDKDFFPDGDQRDPNTTSVAVRTVPIAERSAFALTPAPSITEWYQHAQAVGSKRKLSPSLQHLQILHKMQSITNIRQLAFSVGGPSDVLYPGDDEDNYDAGYDQADAKARRNRRRRRSQHLRDGRYRSIDPIQATKAALPPHPPLLSHKKYRLPMRADVGFPNTPFEQIQQKQAEIQRETEWEEASPRLIVLVTSDDLGTAVEDREGQSVSSAPSANQHTTTAQELRKAWNGGGAPGMPWAGPELLRAKEASKELLKRNQYYSTTQQQQDQQRRTSKLTHKINDAWKQRERLSVLAPPLDANYSRTLGWRPRPFHDRHPGMKYRLCCPLSVDFDVGAIEPLLCSLTLYSLPFNNRSGPKAAQTLPFGKMSEEFWFPAGDWEDRLNLESFMEDESTQADDLAKEWQARKQKGVFSYHPSALENGEMDVHIVLQVYKVSHVDSASAYLTSKHRATKTPSNKALSSLRKRLTKKFSKKSIIVQGEMLDKDLAAAKTNYRAHATLDKFGTQFMTPLCFGVTPMFSAATAHGANQWPDGETHSVQLYAFPTKSESPEAFCERLTNVLSRQSTMAAINASKNLQTPRKGLDTVREEKTATSSYSPANDDSSTSSRSTPSPKKRGLRKFLSPSKRKLGRKESKSPIISPAPKAKSSSSPTPHATEEVCSPINGRATLFSSRLNTDFLQALLTNPAETNPATADQQHMRKLFVDVTGDSAIMVDPRQDLLSVPDLKSNLKRSSLIRLPRPSKPSGYVQESEFRELLFLPPRSDKTFFMDPASSYRSLTNLLYVYPRQLRETKGMDSSRGNGNLHQRYSVKIRLIQSSVAPQESGSIEASTDTVDAFYNPVPWSGPELLDTVYTRIPGDHSDESDSLDSIHDGIRLHDEFKIRLPHVLDGTYLLHFTLFEVSMDDGLTDENASVDTHSRELTDDDCGVMLTAIAEATIPLSISSARDPATGIKAATVIPNGYHRIKLGSVLLQLETRLVSSVHTTDAALAGALRDFPFPNDIDAKNSISEQLGSMLMTSNKATLLRQGSVESTPDKLIFSVLFSNASGSSLMSHFQPLLFMHLANLINTGYDLPLQEESASLFLMENARSLFEVMRKIKTSLVSEFGQLRGNEKIAWFLKASLDAFDEDHLRPATANDDAEEDKDSEYLPIEPARSSSEQYSEFGDEDVDDFDGGAIRKIKKNPTRNEKLDLRISRTFSAIEGSGTPFARVAYGFSKTDRMRLEAEMEVENNRFTYLADDDETVITTTAGLQPNNAEMSMEDAREAFTSLSFAGAHDGIDESTDQSDNSPKAATYNSAEPSASHYPRSLGELGLARRVRSAAQVMLAPCVTPNLSAVLSSKMNSPANGKHVDRSFGNSFGFASVAAGSNDTSDHGTTSSMQATDSSTLKEPVSQLDTIKEGYHTPIGTFRNSVHCPVLNFSILSPEEGPIQPARGAFLYESILVLWLHCQSGMLDQNSGRGNQSNGNGGQGKDAALFFHHMDLLLPLCLKSIVLRYSRVAGPEHTPQARVIGDYGHLETLEPFLGMIARCLIAQALEKGEEGLARSVEGSDSVLDFLIGLFAVLHPAQVQILTSAYFKTLRDAETSHLNFGSKDELDFEWTTETLQRVQCSRQLRIRAIEKLAVLPNFLSLNFPPKLAAQKRSRNQTKATWKMQVADVAPETFSLQIFDEEDGLPSLPRSGWLADLLASECLSMCALSCEAVVAEAMAHIELQEHDSGKSKVSAMKKHPTSSLARKDLLMFQSIAIHSITCVYELLLRRHAMDKRYQTETCRSRIAAIFSHAIFERSIASVRWLARMEATHKVRSLWLLCFVYVLQEAPENFIRQSVKKYCDPDNIRIHRFIRLLRLSSSTFQSFIDQPKYSMFPAEVDIGISPWLLQESFNTICATTIVVVEECGIPTSASPKEQKKMIQGILDLLLHILTTPHSSVTHLRAVGGAIQALEKFGAAMFIEITGGSLQHWIRIILSLMNSISLSVRSIAVDFVVSLFGSSYDLYGNVDELSMMFSSLLPEVAAREVGLYSVNGHVKGLDDVEKSIWSLRRSFADVEDTNPLDDDRVDPQLSPILSVFCRAGQAIIDGVIIEMRLRGSDCIIVGTRMKPHSIDKDTFDADEESLFEAASFFVPEIAPLQRLRWLHTLKLLHEAKGQWAEAGETLMMCARAISDSIPHLRQVWRPSRFQLWSDTSRSLWLDTVGEELNNPERGNEQVMDFADNFLEPTDLFAFSKSPTSSGKLPQPSVSDMCVMLTNFTQQAVSLYMQEGDMEELAYLRLESLVKVLMGILEDHGTLGDVSSIQGIQGFAARRRRAEDEASLRRVIATLSGEMTKLAEALIPEPSTPRAKRDVKKVLSSAPQKPYFVRLLLKGKKPSRFIESTTLPTFMAWDAPCICRVPKAIVEGSFAKTVDRPDMLERAMCMEFVNPILECLKRDGYSDPVVLKVASRESSKAPPDDENKLYIHISFVDIATKDDGQGWTESRHFLFQEQAFDSHSNGNKHSVSGNPTADMAATLIEYTVAQTFPCPLSRQRTVLTSEFRSFR